jgi:hypothetical protein
MTANQLQKKYERDLRKLQRECKHKRISPWTINEWAPGHSGDVVRFCRTCWKRIDTKKPELPFAVTTASGFIQKYEQERAKQ